MSKNKDAQGMITRLLTNSSTVIVITFILTHKNIHIKVITQTCKHMCELDYKATSDTDKRSY